MKTLILYTTKHGAAADIARRIAGRMDGAETVDLEKGDIPPLADYGCVVLGGPLYAGALRKEARAFAEQNAEVLAGKRLGLFLSGLDETSAEENLQKNFPEALLAAAKAKAFLGGAYDPAKCGFLEKTLMKAITKHKDAVSTVSDEKIAAFAEALAR